MSLEQTPWGTFFLKGDYETKAAFAGGMDGFPIVTKAAWRKRHQEKLDKGKGGKKN